MPAPQAIIDSLNKLFDDKDAATNAATAATSADAAAKAAADAATKAHADANNAATTVKTAEAGFISDLQAAIEGTPATAASPAPGAAS